MEKLKSFWTGLPAQRKKQLVLGTGCAVLVTILWQFLSGEQYERSEAVTPSSVRLTADNSRQLSMDALSARVRSMERTKESMAKQLGSLEQKASQMLSNEQKALESAREAQRQIDKLNERLSRQNDALNQEGIEVDERGTVPSTAKANDSDGELGESVSLLNDDTQQAAPIDFSNVPDQSRGRRQGEKNIWADSSRFQAPPSRTTGKTPGSRPSDQDIEGTEPSGPSVSMTVIESTPDSATRERKAQAEEKTEEGQYLPAGSIVSGTLITGLDAPTNNSAKGNPHPALVRIKTESILPNRYRADLRECFLIISGYGDMSSERAYLRSETLSCINSEGKAMETRLESFAVGEDGKAGVRGRLVTKTGQLLAKSTMAAFLSSASEVFGSSSIPTISTTPSDTLPFQQALSDEAVQSAAMQGTGAAMERIAEYYLNMADQIFPILEIDAGREIDLILNTGTAISFKH
jgi:conjugal transfer pilus assembly protein TraB